MLMLLLPITFVAIFLYRFGAEDRPSDALHSWQGDVLLASAFFGVIVLGITEGLSLLHSINQTWLEVIWSIVLVGITLKGWHTERFKRSWRKARIVIASLRVIDNFFLISIGILLALLFAVAIVSPPNNVDAMQYHMPRVMQWAQNQSLEHFPAIYDSQNARPYWSEIAILNLRTLWGSDRPANLVQWFSLLGSMIAAAGIVSVLGGNKTAQWVSSAFVFSIPMGILQATTPKNDLVSAFWILSLLYFVVLSKRRSLTNGELLGLSFSLGLGMLTKGTFLPFAFPCIVWFFLPRIFRNGLKRSTLEGLVLIAVVSSINGAFWYRNVVTYGGPYGSSIPVPGIASTPFLDEVIANSQSQSSLIDSESQGRNFPIKLLSASSISIPFKVVSSPEIIQGPFEEFLRITKVQFVKIARMAAMNMMTPVSWLNTRIINVLIFFPNIFPNNFIGMLEASAWNYAMMAGNPIHFILIFFSIVLTCFWALKDKYRLLAQLSLVAIAGYGFISFGGCSDWTVCMRYQMPYFVLGGVIFAGVIQNTNQTIGRIVTILFLLYAIPYILLNRMRPVIGHTPWPTRIDSVFKIEPSDILFAHSPGIQDEYEVIAERIKEARCYQVGLSLDDRDFEYTFWWLLEAPQSGFQLRHVTASPKTSVYMDPMFEPCAVICTQCAGMDSTNNVPLASDYGHVQLFLKLESP